MTMIHARLMAFGLAAALLAGCKKDEVPEPDLGYTYFPVAKGAWVEYQVDSLWRDDRAGVLDSVSYRLMQRIEELYTDDEGRPCQRIHRYVKDANDAWVVRDVWTSTRSTTAAEMTEENYRRLKLSFPVRISRTWDIHILGTGAADDPDTDDELLVAYREIGEPWSANGLTFPNTLLLRNTVPANLVDKRNFEERYADGVGMVAKYWEETDTQYTYPEPTFQLVIEVKGWRLDMVAVAYGTD